MIDFITAKQKALFALMQTEKVIELSQHEFEKLDLWYASVWEVDTEILDQNGKVLEIKLHICFGSDFPLNFPKLYLSLRDYNSLRFIPHVDSDRQICLFDSEVTRPNPENPEQVVLLSLSKAKKILTEGISSSNHSDFEEEFLAYWKCEFEDGQLVRNNILCLINPSSPTITPLILKLSTEYKGYKYIIHNNDIYSERFKYHLERKGIKYQELTCFYWGNLSLNFKPPYDYTNLQTLNIIESTHPENVKSFKKFLNKNLSVRFVLASVSVKGKIVFVGWFYRSFNLQRKGFRNGTLTPFSLLKTFQRNDIIVRRSLEILTMDRLTKRTLGESILKSNSFLIAGVGSIGSNLVQFLNSMNYPSFRLVDKDRLRVENIGRHLLGFSYVNNYKTRGLKDFLLDGNPLQDIETKENSIIEVVKSDQNFVNGADFIFLVTGKTNIDKWVGSAIKEEIIKKPVFFIWVEPYLAAGHCLYIYPNSKGYSSFFTKNDLFIYNVISANYYESGLNNMTLKEAGCQTTFIPYSATNVIGFLSALFPIISKIIETPVLETKAFTWIGNINFIKQQRIELSEFAQTRGNYDLIEH